MALIEHKRYVGGVRDGRGVMTSVAETCMRGEEANGAVSSPTNSSNHHLIIEGYMKTLPGYTAITAPHPQPADPSQELLGHCFLALAVLSAYSRNPSCKGLQLAVDY